MKYFKKTQQNIPLKQKSDRHSSQLEQNLEKALHLKERTKRCQIRHE